MVFEYLSKWHKDKVKNFNMVRIRKAPLLGEGHKSLKDLKSSNGGERELVFEDMKRYLFKWHKDKVKKFNMVTIRKAPLLGGGTQILKRFEVK